MEQNEIIIIICVCARIIRKKLQKANNKRDEVNNKQGRKVAKGT